MFIVPATYQIFFLPEKLRKHFGPVQFKFPVNNINITNVMITKITKTITTWITKTKNTHSIRIGQMKTIYEMMNEINGHQDGILF